VWSDNHDAWSGDHCMDPAAVPGVWFANRALQRIPDQLQDVAPALLAELGLGDFP
jgi:hypothetical protein